MVHQGIIENVPKHPQYMYPYPLPNWEQGYLATHL